MRSRSLVVARSSFAPFVLMLALAVPCGCSPRSEPAPTPVGAPAPTPVGPSAPVVAATPTPPPTATGTTPAPATPAPAPSAPAGAAPVVNIPTPPRAAPTPAAEPGEDFLAEAKAWQTRPNPSPSATFRPGHVTPRALPASALKAARDGFELTLPSGAPIVTPTAFDGKIFVSGGFHSKEFYAVEAKTGKPVWGLDLDDDGPSSAACAEGRCAFNTESCTIFTVDAATGKQLWSAWLGDPLTSSPAIAGGRVFASYPAAGHAHASHVLAAFDLATGKVLWQRWIDSDVQSSPVVSDSKVFAATFAGSLYRFDPATGEILSARRVRATSAPTIANGDVHFSQRTETAGHAAEEGLMLLAEKDPSKTKIIARKTAIYLDQTVQLEAQYAASGKALDTANGFAGGAPSSANAGAALHNVGKGSVQTMQSHQGSRVLIVAESVVAAMGDEIVSNDPVTGAKRWSYKATGDMAGAGGALVTAPASVHGEIYVATLAGEVLRMDAPTGRIVARYAVGAPVRSQPIMVDGWIYVGTENGRLVGIDTHDANVTGWTTWGGDAARTGTAR